MYIFPRHMYNAETCTIFTTFILFVMNLAAVRNPIFSLTTTYVTTGIGIFS